MIDFDKLSKSSPNSFWKYLESLGWTPKTSKDGQMKRFTLHDRGEPIHLFFSMNAPSPTKQVEFSTALSTLKQVYGTSPTEIFRRTSSLMSDLMKAVIPDHYVKNETIDLKTASSFIDGLKGFLASTATTEASGEKNFSRNIKKSIEYVNSCRFGHTFSSSFGFVIESPVEPREEVMPFIDQETPHGRKVFERISKSFEIINTAKQKQSATPIVSSDSGISSNMCDDLIGLLEDSGLHKASFYLEASPEFKSDKFSRETEPFVIAVQDIPMLKEASFKIRGTVRPEPVIIKGMVRRLETSGRVGDIFDDRSTREVIISWDSSEHGNIKVRLQLNPNQYRDAIDAHSNNNPYLASGMLSREGRSWVLSEVQEARVML